jgi:hypothetical protein
MADWKFTDDYGTRYPALQWSILANLAFSDHNLTGTQFTGTLDVAASGVALETLGALVNMSSIALSGTVTDANDILTVALMTTDTAGFTSAIASVMPIIGTKVTDAFVAVNTIVATTDPPDDGPPTDTFTLSITFTIGPTTVTISSPVPYNGGLFIVNGTFSGVAITLEDLEFLMGNAGGGGTSWFPSSQLGPYNSTALELIGVSITLYAKMQPFSLSIVNLSVVIGITGIPLLDEKLYLNPLAVCVMVSDPTGKATVSWGIEGSLALCNYAHPGDFQNPDFTFDFTLGLTDFSFSADLENPSAQPVNVMIQDLIGQGVSVGLSDTLTINQFTFEASADKSSGGLQDLSTAIAMSGGFGLLQNLDLDSISITVTYSAD